MNKPKITYANVYRLNNEKILGLEFENPEAAHDAICREDGREYIETLEITRPEKKDYWQQRCEAAEAFIYTKGTGISYEKTGKAFDKWQELMKQRQSHPFCS